MKLFFVFYKWNPQYPLDVKLPGFLGVLGVMAKYPEIGQSVAVWPRSLFLANYNVIGTLGMFG